VAEGVFGMRKAPHVGKESIMAAKKKTTKKKATTKKPQPVCGFCFQPLTSAGRSTCLQLEFHKP
jgi:hypothetical protein